MDRNGCANFLATGTKPPKMNVVANRVSGDCRHLNLLSDDAMMAVGIMANCIVFKRVVALDTKVKVIFSLIVAVIVDAVVIVVTLTIIVTR